uniref:Uncharacterized protein AlNc14C116G6543 n=1 Tax=Albugo laibachii Nc14 TaxID=890382 RepID=F0WJ08_9STRA|nr:conserved hypothetical protein [Albugo laibachii Nc14]|eukprot:CCA21254.1 conserved hypothetical protein [Albugo laibachii Nc14]
MSSLYHLNPYNALQELSKEAHQWTLHSDRELHLYLRSYSGSLIGRIKSLEDSVRQLSTQADRSNVRLRNTLNQFLLLSDSQFIENRVYDEEQDEFSSNVTVKTDEKLIEESEKEPENSQIKAPPPGEESIASKYRKALEMGMEAMKLFAIYDDDEETSEPNFDTVLDIYNERPLPFIIGSREFLEDDTLGLGAAPEIDRSSSSSFGDDSSSDYSASDSASASFSDESNESEEMSNERRKQKSKGNDGNGLFRQALVPADHTEDDFSDEDGFDGQNALELDSDNESGLFGRTQRSQPAIERSRKMSSSSSDSDTSGLFGSSRNAPPITQARPAPNIAQAAAVAASSRAAQEVKQSAIEKSSRMSSSSSDSDTSGLFGSSTNAPAITQARPAPNIAQAAAAAAISQAARKAPAREMSSSFSDTDSEEKSSKGKSAIPMMKVAPFIQSAPFLSSESREPRGEIRHVEPRKVSSDSSDEDSELFGSKTLETSTSQAVREQRDTEPMAYKSSLFDDDSDNESTVSGLFGSSSRSNPIPPTTQPPVPTLPNASNAIKPQVAESSSEDGSDSGLFSSKIPAKAPRDSVSDSDDWSDDGQGLFGSAPASTSRSTAVPPTQSKNGSTITQTQAKREIDSDSDDWDDDGSLSLLKSDCDLL